MPVREFIEHVGDKAPAFRCYRCGDYLERLDLTAGISHNLGRRPARKPSRASRRSLVPLEHRSSNSTATTTEWSSICDSRSDTAGVAFSPIQEMA